MEDLVGRTVVVVGATGNVGPFVARALLERGATVAVLSRSGDKLRDLHEHLVRTTGAVHLERLHTFAGDAGDPDDAARLRDSIAEQAGTPSAVIASVGEFVTTASLLDASPDLVRRALESSLIAHLMVARTFLPTLTASAGTYVMLQGPLAFEPYPGLGSHLVSIATAGQHMLFRALAQELDDSPVRVVELVIHSLIRERTTQPGSPVPGADVGAFTAHLLATPGDELHGRSIHLRSPKQLTEAGVHIETPTASPA